LTLLLTTITTAGTFWAKTDFSRRGDRLDRLGPGMSVPVFDLAALRAAALFGAKAWLCLRKGPGSRRYVVPAVKASSLRLAYVDHHDKAYLGPSGG